MKCLIKARAFIAVDVSNQNGIEKLQQEIISNYGLSQQDIKPVEKQNFHFTLVFLNMIELETIDKIKSKLLEVQFKPIKIIYTCVGIFPNPNFARVLWIKVDDEGRKELSSLATVVLSKIAELGFRLDSKQFTPHMTIFRVKRKLNLENILSYYEGKTFGSDIIDRVHLKRSDLTAAGPVYSNIFTVYAK